MLIIHSLPSPGECMYNLIDHGQILSCCVLWLLLAVHPAWGMRKSFYCQWGSRNANYTAFHQMFQTHFYLMVPVWCRLCFLVTVWFHLKVIRIYTPFKIQQHFKGIIVICCYLYSTIKDRFILSGSSQERSFLSWQKLLELVWQTLVGNYFFIWSYWEAPNSVRIRKIRLDRKKNRKIELLQYFCGLQKINKNT